MTSGAHVYLVDTNILIYAYDAADVRKRAIALDVLTNLRQHRLGVLTVQVLGEFFTNVTRKPLEPLTPEEARLTALRLYRSWPVLDLTSRMFVDAVRGVTEHKLSYWDALLWATAQEERVPFILTEDQQHLRLVEDVRYLNPFLPEFDMARLS